MGGNKVNKAVYIGIGLFVVFILVGVIASKVLM